jgi:hypothetical protein
MKSDLILSTVLDALNNHEPFQLPCDDIQPGYLLPLVSLEVNSLSRHYHQSFWGDNRDQGIAPLLCVDVEYVINAADRLEDKEIIEVIAAAFENAMGVRLFKCSLESEMTTSLVKGRVITRQSSPKFKLRASQDPRLLDIDASAHYEEWKKENGKS